MNVSFEQFKKNPVSAIAFLLVLGVGYELNSKKAKWQIHAYGNVGHAFTNPEANQRENGLFYDRYADEHSWNEMKSFFSKIF